MIHRYYHCDDPYRIWLIWEHKEATPAHLHKAAGSAALSKDTRITSRSLPIIIISLFTINRCFKIYLLLFVLCGIES
jgi:hypothetical protein